MQKLFGLFRVHAKYGKAKGMRKSANKPSKNYENRYWRPLVCISFRSNDEAGKSTRPQGRH